MRDYGLHAAEDDEIIARATQEDRIVVSADTAFGTLLALRGDAKPSVVLFRRVTDRRPERQVTLLLTNLPDIQDALLRGSVIVLEETRIRIRGLPIDEEQ